jgi:very-short-patch-repair endonuclease
MKARRQFACGPWILDFAFWGAHLAVEIDGDTHATPEGIAWDARRAAWLAAHGWGVLRFTNPEVLENLEGVLEAIAAALNARRSPHPDPLPEGEGGSAPSPSGRGPG